MKGPTMYIDERNGGYYLAGTRVSLDSIVYGFLRGESPESIAEAFSPLPLEAVYGAITVYLANRAELDEYLRRAQIEIEQLRQQAAHSNAELHRKLDAARLDIVSRR